MNKYFSQLTSFKKEIISCKQNVKKRWRNAIGKTEQNFVWGICIWTDVPREP
jgi:hypothetical protein